MRWQFVEDNNLAEIFLLLNKSFKSKSVHKCETP